MISNDKLIKAVGAYLDNELMPNLDQNGIQKVLTGTAISLALNRYRNITDVFKDNKMVKMLGIIDEQGNIDIETLSKELKHNIPQDGVKVEVPMIGKLTFHKSDIDKLNEYIQMV